MHVLHCASDHFILKSELEVYNDDDGDNNNNNNNNNNIIIIIKIRQQVIDGHDKFVCHVNLSLIFICLFYFCYVVTGQEPITRSVQLPYCVFETAFSQVNLFLEKLFPRIG